LSYLRSGDQRQSNRKFTARQNGPLQHLGAMIDNQNGVDFFAQRFAFCQMTQRNESGIAMY
jgi:hypothetical protein